MDITMLIISIASMIATIISTIFAIKAKNEARLILTQIKNTEINSDLQKHDIKNSGKIDVENSGKNNGIMAGIVTGGIDKRDR
ncbi:hypothetical protein SAMN04488542_10525 [Fontibacillus panacisegetis]|uniref:Uncharacterized protein n=1 Tax=Fontibacillus panacisegetis TaxID=670482 RepID=A0A1G7HT32_9BACL|nr:hypothetical protein [Fontibacillus panacisegetis]SDF03600.1 hypothetical protein SAMN04488542_10525 [Fontibacillus panacisegetis]